MVRNLLYYAWPGQYLGALSSFLKPNWKQASQEAEKWNLKNIDFILFVSSSTSFANMYECVLVRTVRSIRTFCHFPQTSGSTVPSSFYPQTAAAVADVRLGIYISSFIWIRSPFTILLLYRVPSFQSPISTQLYKYRFKNKRKVRGKVHFCYYYYHPPSPATVFLYYWR
jgi:hypothetical protein